MRLPSGRGLQRWLMPILAVLAAVQIGALWYVNGKTAAGAQHSLNAQQSEINSGGVTVQQAQAEIDALLLDIRGLQVTVSTLRADDASLGATLTALQNQVASIPAQPSSGGNPIVRVLPPVPVPPRCRERQKHC